MIYINRRGPTCYWLIKSCCILMTARLDRVSWPWVSLFISLSISTSCLVISQLRFNYRWRMGVDIGGIAWSFGGGSIFRLGSIILWWNIAILKYPGSIILWWHIAILKYPKCLGLESLWTMVGAALDIIVTGIGIALEVGVAAAV